MGILAEIKNISLEDSHVSSNIVPHPVGEIVSLVRWCNFSKRTSSFKALNNLLYSQIVRKLSQVIPLCIIFESNILRAE